MPFGQYYRAGAEGERELRGGLQQIRAEGESRKWRQSQERMARENNETELAKEEMRINAGLEQARLQSMQPPKGLMGGQEQAEQQKQKTEAETEGIPQFLFDVMTGRDKSATLRDFAGRGKRQFADYMLNEDGSVTVKNPEGQNATIPQEMVDAMLGQHYGLKVDRKTGLMAAKLDAKEARENEAIGFQTWYNELDSLLSEDERKAKGKKLKAFQQAYRQGWTPNQAARELATPSITAEIVNAKKLAMDQARAKYEGSFWKGKTITAMVAEAEKEYKSALDKYMALNELDEVPRELMDQQTAMATGQEEEDTKPPEVQAVEKEDADITRLKSILSDRTKLNNVRAEKGQQAVAEMVMRVEAYEKAKRKALQRGYDEMLTAADEARKGKGLMK